MRQFLNFFSFSQNDQTASFYRPLSTQVFFFTFQKLFGLVAWPYYLFGLLLFAYTLYLVYNFSGSKVAAFIYGISISNFTRVYFLSAYQELFLVIFSLLTLINFKAKPYKSLFFFALALLSKETAIVLPLLVIVMNFEYIKSNLHHLRYTIYATTILTAIYLYFRFFYFGLATGDSYLWNFSLVKAANTLTWYVLWCFGAPELLVDYVGSGLRLIPRFFTDYATWWSVIIFPLLGVITSTIFLFISKLRHCASPTNVGAKAIPASLDCSQARRLLQYFVIRNDKLIKFILFFLITLLPVLFLPSHKFTLELGLPLVGFSLALASVIPNKLNVLSFCFFSLFIFLNISMNYLTYTRHYSVSRSQISKRVYGYLLGNYPKYPNNSYFEFKNDTVDNGLIWGQSKQISQSLSGSDMFRVLYNDNKINVFYEDDSNARPKNTDKISLSTSQFLNQ